MVNLGHKAVYWASIRDRYDILLYLIEEKGAIYEVADMKGFTVLDHALVNGNYKVSKYLYDRGLRFKSLDFYQLESDRFFQAEVDFESVIEYIIAGKEECKLVFRTVEPITYKDPVIDPRESWSEWGHRIKDFKEPIIVERADLPEELRPENRGVMGKMSNYLNKTTQKSYTLKELEENEDWTEEKNDEENKNSIIPPKNPSGPINAIIPVGNEIQPENVRIERKISDEQMQENKDHGEGVKMSMRQSENFDLPKSSPNNQAGYDHIETDKQQYEIEMEQNDPQKYGNRSQQQYEVEEDQEKNDGFANNNGFMSNAHDI